MYVCFKIVDHPNNVPLEPRIKFQHSVYRSSNWNTAYIQLQIYTFILFSSNTVIVEFTPTVHCNFTILSFI